MGKRLNNKGQHVTINIGYLADSANFELNTLNEIHSNLIVGSLEMPNAPYY